MGQPGCALSTCTPCPYHLPLHSVRFSQACAPRAAPFLNACFSKPPPTSVHAAVHLLPDIDTPIHTPLHIGTGCTQSRQCHQHHQHHPPPLPPIAPPVSLALHRTPGLLRALRQQLASYRRSKRRSSRQQPSSTHSWTGACGVPNRIKARQGTPPGAAQEAQR